jgi:hypothetical protein
MNIFNISTKKVGGLRFIKIGRLCVSFAITKSYRDLNAPKHPRHFTDIRGLEPFRMSSDGVLVVGFTDEFADFDGYLTPNRH